MRGIIRQLHWFELVVGRFSMNLFAILGKIIMRYFSKVSGITMSVFIFGLIVFQCGKAQDDQTRSGLGMDIVELPLAGDIAKRYADISGLTLYEDQVIILPQYPDRFSPNSIFRIPKANIIEYLDDPKPSSKLSAIKIEIDDKEIPDRIPGFQGYESILFVGKRVYLTIEINLRGSMKGILVEGSISDTMEKIELDEASLDSLPMPLKIKNYSYESMVHTGEKLLLFYEANGSNLTHSPRMIQLNRENGHLSLVPFLNLEYRITDATKLDENGRFWVINYFWPGDYDILKPAADQLSAFITPPLIYSPNSAIERLVEMKYDSERIVLSDTPPLIIRSDSKHDSRNWEGIVRLDNRGFILATDKHPRTILAFVPYD